MTVSTLGNSYLHFVKFMKFQRGKKQKWLISTLYPPATGVGFKLQNRFVLIQKKITFILHGSIPKVIHERKVELS